MPRVLSGVRRRLHGAVCVFSWSLFSNVRSLDRNRVQVGALSLWACSPVQNVVRQFGPYPVQNWFPILTSGIRAQQPMQGATMAFHASAE